VDFSVIVPTFRRPDALREALQSVLSQPGIDLESIVIDDSPEGSAEPAVRDIADPRVMYVKNPAPSGGRPAIVRNMGWPKAVGKLIHFLDDDDRVPEGHYRAVMERFEAAPQVGVVFGRVEPFGTDETQLTHERSFFANAARRAAWCERRCPRWCYSARMFFHETMLVCGAAVIRRNCVVALGGFDANLPLMEDVDFFARAIRSFGASFLDRVALHYRIWPSLMHGRDVREEVHDSYRLMHARYCAEHGFVEFNAVRLLARLLRLV
jgi:glycosyltransferase involved in cell wall biosynthesis